MPGDAYVQRGPTRYAFTLDGAAGDSAFALR